MSRSNTPSRSTTSSRKYGEIFGSIFSGGSGNLEGKQQQQEKIRSSSVEKSLSDLHSTRSTTFSKVQDESTVSEEAKRIFRERRRQQQKSPTRTLATTTAEVGGWDATQERRNPTPEHRQHHASPGKRFATPPPRSSVASSGATSTTPSTSGSKSRTATPERRHQFRLLPFSSGGRNHPGRSTTTPVVDRSADKIVSYARGVSKSPAKRRDDDIDVVAVCIPHPHAMELQHEQKEHGAQPSSSANDAEKSETEAVISSLQKELKELKGRYDRQMQVIEEVQNREQQASANTSDAMAHLQNTVQVQNEQLRFLESRLKERDMEIENLKLELEQGSKQRASLELELEVHDFKFSIYDDYRRLMDKQRLDRRDAAEGDDEYGSSDSDLGQSEWNSQQHILSKLERLEQLFEKSKTEAANRYATLYEEHRSALTKNFFLERQQPIDTLNGVGDIYDEMSATEYVFFDDANEDSADCSTTESKPGTIVALLTKRIKILERDNLRLNLHTQGLREEIQRVRAMQNDLTIFKDENEVNALRLEKDTLINKITALETEIGFTSGEIDDKTRTRRYRMLEKNLNGYIAEIMSLEDKMRAKECVIAKLKERDLTRRLCLENNSVVSEPQTEPTHRWYENVDNEGITRPKSGNLKPKLASDIDIDGMMSSDVPRADVMRNRLNKRIKELKDQTKKMTIPSNTGTGARNNADEASSSSRVALLRKRMDELRNAHELITI